MVKYELIRFFKTKLLRILFVSLCVVPVSILSRSLTYELFYVTELIGENDSITIVDLIINMFNTTQLIMFVLLPVLFTILISDTLVVDIQEGMIEYLITRQYNRAEYIINKFIFLFIISMFFITLVVGISVLTWLITGSTFDGINIHFIFQYSELTDLPNYYPWLTTFTAIILGMNLISAIVMLISFFTKSSVAPVWMMFFIGLIHNAFYVLDVQLILRWLPLVQYSRIETSLYEGLGILRVDGYTPLSQNVYMILLFSFLVILLILLVRHTEVYKESNKEYR